MVSFNCFAVELAFKLISTTIIIDSMQAKLFSNITTATENITKTIYFRFAVITRIIRGVAFIVKAYFASIMAKY